MNPNKKLIIYHMQYESLEIWTKISKAEIINIYGAIIIHASSKLLCGPTRYENYFAIHIIYLANYTFDMCALFLFQQYLPDRNCFSCIRQDLCHIVNMDAGALNYQVTSVVPKNKVIIYGICISSLLSTVYIGCQ